MVSTNDESERDDDTVNRSEALEMLETEADEPTNHNRRRFLKGAASVAATLGFTGTAAAVDPTGQVELDLAKRPFETQAAAVGAVESHGQDVLDQLADHGYLDHSDAEAFEWNVSAWRIDDTATARIDTEMDLDDGQLRVSVEPQTGRAYAVDTGGESWTRIDATGDVKPLDCTITYRCLDSSNCLYCEETEVCCDSGGCFVGGGTGNCCSSCDSTCGC